MKEKLIRECMTPNPITINLQATLPDAYELMKEASETRDPAALSELQQKWTKTCLKYGQDQTKATMTFVQQCGKQALNSAAPVQDDPSKD